MGVNAGSAGWIRSGVGVGIVAGRIGKRQVNRQVGRVVNIGVPFAHGVGDRVGIIAVVYESGGNINAIDGHCSGRVAGAVGLDGGRGRVPDFQGAG